MSQLDQVEDKIRRSMAAWNAMTESERAAALEAAGTASAALAMRHMGWDIPDHLPPAGRRWR